MIKIEQTKNMVELFDLLPLFSNLNNYYPDFNYWYINKVIPGTVVDSDIVLVAKNNSIIVGGAIGKKSTTENKLRCVRVLPQCQNSGIGIKLIDAMISQLECEKPHCTVSEEMLHLYSRPFVNRYNFDLTSVDKGTYRRGKLEYFFNQR